MQSASYSSAQNGPPWKRSPTGSAGVFACHALSPKILGAASRAVSEPPGIAVVPPTSRVVGRPVEDLEMDIGMLKPDANELDEVFRADPDRQPSFIERLVVDIADADACHAQCVLVSIQGTERLAECLAHAIPAIGPHRHIDTDLLVSTIESN